MKRLTYRPILDPTGNDVRRRALHRPHVQALIRTLEAVEAKEFYQGSWQEEGPVCKNLEDLHQCGNTACVGGYAALTPEFHADGGYVDLDGGPAYRRLQVCHSQAFAQFLGISDQLAGRITNAHAWELFNIQGWDGWSPTDVIKILQRLLDAGEGALLK